MLIGIDGNEANLENRVGVNQYAINILESIAKSHDFWSQKHRVIVYLKDPPSDDLPYPQKNFSYKVLSGEKAWIVSKLTPHLLLTSEKPDVFFSPDHYLPPFAMVPMVCTIHDLGYLKFSGQFKNYDFWQLKYWSAWSMFISKRIISVSNSTRMDIVRHYKFASKKVRVVYHGYDLEKFNQAIKDEDVRRTKEKYHIVSEYILFIGTLKPSKNVEGLLAAFGLIKREFPEISLVIGGKKGWLYETIFEKSKILRLKDVIFTDFIAELDKPLLLKGAKAFIIPSFWEGFGMDALSAMAVGTPVIASNVGGLKEVCGDSAILINPNSVESIADGVKKVLLMDKSQYNNLIEKGLRRAAGFSWDKAAMQTIETLEEAAR